jgi:hypothetical protein
MEMVFVTFFKKCDAVEFNTENHPIGITTSKMKTAQGNYQLSVYVGTSFNGEQWAVSTSTIEFIVSSQDAIKDFEVCRDMWNKLAGYAQEIGKSFYLDYVYGSPGWYYESDLQSIVGTGKSYWG